jgi:hypothetical protein
VDGSDDILFLNCIFENTTGNGLDLKSCNNVTIWGCTFTNIGGTGIRMRSTGSTDGVSIVNCTLTDIDDNGISAAKRHATSVDHTNVFIYNTTVTISGVTGTSGSQHGIYMQATDFVIENCSVLTSVDGNGISVRTAGIVYNTTVDCVSDNDSFGAAIKYFSDHLAGSIPAGRTTDKLTIAFNTIDGNSDLWAGIQIKKSGTAGGSYTDAEWFINDVRIYGNTVTGVTTNDYLYDGWASEAYTAIIVEGVAEW